MTNRRRRRFDPAYRSPMTMAYARRMVLSVLLLSGISLFHQMYGYLHDFTNPYTIVSAWSVLAATVLTVLPWRSYRLKGQRAGLYWLVLISICWWLLSVGIYAGLWSQILLKISFVLGLTAPAGAITGDTLFSLTGMAQFLFSIPVGVYTWLLISEEMTSRAPSDTFRFMELS